MKLIEEEISKIIDNKQIKTVFQPIISLRDGSILGHEALKTQLFTTKNKLIK